MTINNVNIGDKFKNGKHLVCEVVDFYEVISLTTGQTIRTECVAKGINTMATNSFIVPFSTILRNKIN